MTEASDIAKLAQKAAGAHTVETKEGRQFLIVPEGFDHIDVTDEHGQKLDTPSYIVQKVTLQTQDSLVEYVNRFKEDYTVLLADIDRNSIVALIDYHSAASADHVAHRAALTLPLSEEWKLWNGISGRLHDQLSFARFIEENAADIRAPAAGDLLDACRDLQAVRKVNFVGAVRTSSENENFSYSEETNAATGKRGEVEVPTKFVLGLPVYFGEPDTELHAFLRWKLDDGKLALGIQLHRVEHVRQAVFKAIVVSIAERTGCLALYGSL